MSKRYHILITDDVTNETHHFETNNILATVTAEEFGDDKSDTTQIRFFDRPITEKEVIKLLAGCINSIMLTVDDPTRVERMLFVSNQVAKQKYVLQKLYGIDNA